MALALRPMTDDEFARWFPSMRDAYARDMTENAGATQADARSKAIADMERIFPGDRPSADQLVFVLELDGEQVGELWLAERDSELGRGLWIYDVHVKESFRGRGHGREAMLLAESEARSRGLSRIALNVFGGNETARNLYRSLDYAETVVFMSKRL